MTPDLPPAGGAAGGPGPGTAAALVIGLGSPGRGDDALGVEVARAVAARALPGVEVCVHEDPTELVELWSGREHVVVIDAVRSGAAAGTVRILRTGTGHDPLPRSTWVGAGRGGTHAFGLAAAVELGRVLRRLPARLTVVGVEAAGIDHGLPLSPPVAAAVPRAVDAVVGDLAGPGRQPAGAAADTRRGNHVSR